MALSFDEYQSLAMLTRTGDANAFFYPALGLAGEAGEVAENIKKMIRDDGGDLTDSRRAALAKELGDVMWYLAALATDCQLTLDQIAEANISKLRSRQERGVLHGSGDDR